MNQKILFLSTHNLASNPRLVKEIKLALDNGYAVEVICFVFRNKGFSMNAQLMANFEKQGVQFHCIEAGKEAGVAYYTSVLKERFYRFTSTYINSSGRALGNAVSRRSSLIIAALKKVKQADWVIGHNPGSLYATQRAAKLLGAKAGFDVEDYHPGEGHDVALQQLTKQLMLEVLPGMQYVSFAAPLIRNAVKSDLGKEGSNWITLLNYFPRGEFVAPTVIDGPLKLVWFSQHISAGRGLEYVLPVIRQYPLEVELHLFGALDESFRMVHLEQIENIIVHEPVSQEELHKRLSQYEVGLALEIATDGNRDLCLTNKLLAYMQAGLFVLASDTKGQVTYLTQYPAHGIAIDVKKEKIVEIHMQQLIDEKSSNRMAGLQRYRDFKESNWESVSGGLLKNWRDTN